MTTPEKVFVVGYGYSRCCGIRREATYSNVKYAPSGVAGQSGFLNSVGSCSRRDRTDLSNEYSFMDTFPLFELQKQRWISTTEWKWIPIMSVCTLCKIFQQFINAKSFQISALAFPVTSLPVFSIPLEIQPFQLTYQYHNQLLYIKPNNSTKKYPIGFSISVVLSCYNFLCDRR